MNLRYGKSKRLSGNKAFITKSQRSLFWTSSSRLLRRWGCKPKPPEIPEIPLTQLQPRHNGIQVDDLSVAVEGVVPVQVDVAPLRRRHLLDQRQGFRVSARLVLREQPRQDGGVVVDDRIRDQPRALVADLDFDVGPAGQLLLAADLGDGRA
jgi:hypothetical protein